MRRIPAITAAAIIAIFGSDAAGTGNVAWSERKPTTVPSGAYISEFATRGATTDGAVKEFIEFCNRGSTTVDIGGRVVAGIGSRIVVLATIPHPTLLTPGSAYLVASTRYTAAIPDQLFETGNDIPDRVRIALLNWAGKVVDAAATTYGPLFPAGLPAPPLTPAEAASNLSLTRVKFTGNTRTDFARMTATPGRC